MPGLYAESGNKNLKLFLVYFSAWFSFVFLNFIKRQKKVTSNNEKNTKTKTNFQGKENGEIPDVKVEEITDDQVPGLIEKATKFCQAKLKVGFLLV